MTNSEDPDDMSPLRGILSVSILFVKVSVYGVFRIQGVKKRLCSSFKIFLFFWYLYRVSYLSAHVLLNLLTEKGKVDKMRGLPSILSLFCNEFNIFINTRARMLDSIYHLALRSL